MASHRANYYEQEIDEDLGEAEIDFAIGNYGQPGAAGYDEGGQAPLKYVGRDHSPIPSIP